jgi:hypothetical protein
MRSFWNRRKSESKEKAASLETRTEGEEQSQVGTSASLTLQQACQEFGRQDLEEVLSWVINLEPRGRDVPSLLNANDRIHYSIAANVMMYDGRVEKARDYLKMSLERCDPSSHWRKELDIVLTNLDDTIKIAQRYWQLNGKGKMLTSEEPRSNAGREDSGDTSRMVAVTAK